jgi:hypothetical protein
MKEKPLLKFFHVSANHLEIWEKWPQKVTKNCAELTLRMWGQGQPLTLRGWREPFAQDLRKASSARLAKGIAPVDPFLRVYTKQIKKTGWDIGIKIFKAAQFLKES